MSFNPRQPRDRFGRWARKGSVRTIAKAAVIGGLSGGPGGAAAAAGTAAGKLAVRGAKTAAVKQVRARKVTRHARTKMPGVDYKPASNVPIGNRKTRGVGVSGLKKNTVPYVRANKRSQTVGVNAGTIIPGTKKRIVVGGYARIESTTKETAVDRAINAKIGVVAPGGSRRGKVAGYLRKNLDVKNPAVRAAVGGAQVRLGTSRGAGPTVIVRRGKHRIAQSKSKAGVQKYDSRMKTIAGQRAKKPRPQRRKAARRRK
ncbi:capsid maturation protease [Mycobacterium phage Phreeze]|nr:capsid maturation protease [Mycobacterium phage Thumb]QDH84874.1 capsid maturation protease [Mycobacterium phage Phreeze]QLF83896.1 capsid maturation protease [Mycobacterium phage Beckerton]